MRQIFDLDTRLGRRVNVFITAVIVLSMATLVTDTHYAAADGGLPGWLWTLELVIWVLFGVEYVMRIVLAPSAWRYVFSFYGIVDLLAVLGGFANVPAGTSLRLLRLLRVFRVPKLVQRSGTQTAVTLRRSGQRRALPAQDGAVRLDWPRPPTSLNLS
ncbi:ion transporter [Candidatus Poriferisodalis sp.]|uniref:ion transporter n=1 Tax=Candidatus Poriferisodalis sp. TaxID=3101277 RepID=UPI003B530411